MHHIDGVMSARTNSTCFTSARCCCVACILLDAAFALDEKWARDACGTTGACRAETDWTVSARVPPEVFAAEAPPAPARHASVAQPNTANTSTALEPLEDDVGRVTPRHRQTTSWGWITICTPQCV